ncbi:MULTISPECIES: MaoC family dehydratase [Gordonia]|uniref:MaoC family dehydratase n=1 Tax=Gordonia aquimaris TaxID=2984863 RepID=A0A9X3D8F6_9ACTN|nr:MULTISPECIES: MaoC family dehydratase [Gordonia]MAU83325.1 acyl dehydratase [Gordonia sp. (in: high G+C Gram-positive bacteria)]MCX2965626.1 MaoC family dehydratase [Gordonia aquimaris]
MTRVVAVGGPYFDDLAVGQRFDDAPSVTITDGMAAAHQAILGDRMRLSLDTELARRVTGVAAPVAHPGLVCDLAIGQSTLATHHVKANLFYRGLRFLRYPHVGDTLATTTEVVGLRENSAKPGRAPTGLAALHIVTTDQQGRRVLDFHRCAMLPLSAGPKPDRTPAADDLADIGDTSSEPVLPDWDLSEYRNSLPGQHFSPDLRDTVFTSSGDVVSSAPELARLTLNIAATHHDARVGQQGRLVYGGHTIGLALAQATRALPNLLTVLDWEGCDHTGPVHEGDTLTSDLHVETATTLDTGGGILGLRSTVVAEEPDGTRRPVLDWRFRALMA